MRLITKLNVIKLVVLRICTACFLPVNITSDCRVLNLSVHANISNRGLRYICDDLVIKKHHALTVQKKLYFLFELQNSS